MPATHRGRPHGGFTLIELMVAIAIAVVLLSLLVGVVSRARSEARRVKCISNLRQINVALASKSAKDGQLRLADAGRWVGDVLDAGKAASGVLFCPDVESDRFNASTGGEAGARFDVWSGRGVGDPNSSRLAGHAPWRATRTDLGEGHYRLTWQVRPNRPSEALVVDYLLRDGLWTTKVIAAPKGYRVDCRTMPDGKRFVSVKVGFTLTYPPNPQGRATDYGYNLMASRLITFNAGRVLMMDYADTLIDFDGYPVPRNDDDDPDAFIPRDRHLGRVNVLLSDSSVQSFDPAELHPAAELYLIGRTRGPNPGGTGTPDGATGKDNGTPKGSSPKE